MFLNVLAFKTLTVDRRINSSNHLLTFSNWKNLSKELEINFQYCIFR